MTSQITQAPVTPAREQRRRFSREWLVAQLIRRAMLIVMLLVIAFFSYRSLRFTSPDNLQSILIAAAPFALIALGQTLVILTGGIDLSVGSIIAMAGMTAAAVANAEFLCAQLRRADGRWLRTWQGPVDGGVEAGEAKILAYAADHGALIDAFVRMAELTGEARWLDEARTTARSLLDLFWDDEAGGVFTTGSDAEALVTRPKELMDNAVPSGNSLAAVGLLRLGALTGDGALKDRAEAIVSATTGVSALFAEAGA